MLRIPVLLVDDDYRVLEELKTIVDWKDMGFKIAATASDGERAFEMYKKHKPKLIVTDLYMPVMDGMDLVERVRREDKDVCFLLISSYEDFQYAKRAVKANVEEYILKNELGREVLTEKLTQLRSVLMLENKNDVFSWRMSCTDYMNSMEETERYLEIRLYDPEYREKMKQVILRPCYYYLFFRQRMLTANIGASEQDIRLDLKHAYQVCEKMRDKYKIKVYFEYSDYLIVGIEASSRVGEPKNIGRNFLANLAEADEKNIHCIYPERLFTLEHLRLYLNEKRRQFDFYRYFVKEDYISLQFFRHLRTVDTHFVFPYHLLDDKIFEEKELYYKAVRHHIDMLFANYDLAGVKRAFRNLLLRYEELSNHQLSYNGEYLFADSEELCDFLCKEYERVLELKEAGKTADYSNVVRRAVDFLNERYGEADISVEDLADHVQLSTGRIAVLFKKETGQTVNDYLTDLRINQAIHLLTHSNLRIYEIASRVGYRTSQYFSKVFVKKTGRRPNEYR